MMLKITGLALAAALTAGAAQAQTQTLKPADRADLQCMAVMATYAGMADAGSVEQQGAIAGTWYFFGKLEGRTPDVDWLARLIAMLPSTTDEDLEAWADDCLAQVAERGQAMSAAAASGS